MAGDGILDQRDFFVSYTAADRAWAEWISWQLEAGGYSVFVQAWDFEPGESFVDRMQEALERAERTIALISRAYLASPYCRDEWTGAFLHDPKGRNRLLQIRIEECEIPRLLRTQIHVDLVGLPRERAKARLLSAIRPGRRKPEQEPPFPNQEGTDRRLRPQGSAPRFPGRTPTIANLPSRNVAFSGRTTVLRQLHRTLGAEANAAVVQSATVHGLGGVGKTQLAVEYAYRYLTDYDIVWWIPAEVLVAVPEHLAQLARRLDLPAAHDQQDLLDGLWEALRQSDRWLLIYDNADDVRGLSLYWPPSGSGHVLVTSRTPSWGVVPTIELGVMRKDEALLFLRKRSQSSDKASLLKLAATLGYLPLALEQAASYMDETKASPAEYLDIFSEHGPELLAVQSPSTEQTVETTWRVSLERVKAQAPAAHGLLNLCAFLHSENIPKSILNSNHGVLPEDLRRVVSDRFTLNQILAIVHRYSLVQVSTDTLSIHRLVQAVIRADLSTDEARTCLSGAVALIESVFPAAGSDAAQWSACSALLPHALEVIDHAQELELDPVRTAFLLNKVAMYLWGRADLPLARRFLEQSIELERLRASDDLTIASRLNNLGLVLWDMGRLDEARSTHERALEIRGRRLAPDCVEIAMSRNNLGAVLTDLENFGAARTVLDGARTTFEHRLGAFHRFTATVLSNLGVVLRNTGELTEAKDVLERALQIWSIVCRSGAYHAGDDSHLDLGQLASERSYLERGLPGDAAAPVKGGDSWPVVNVHFTLEDERTRAVERARSSGQPAAVGTVMDNLGTVYADLGRLEEAQRLLVLALGIRELHLGEGHPDVAWSLHNIATVMADMGQTAGALEIMEEVACLRQARLGRDHPDVATTLNNLATMHADREDFPRSRQYLSESLTIRQEVLGPRHRATERVAVRLLDLKGRRPSGAAGDQ